MTDARAHRGDDRMTVWDTLPRLLQELCDGHPNYAIEVYACDLPNGVRSWYCKGCYPQAQLQSAAQAMRRAEGADHD